jgi:hypothetical protein
VTNSALPVLGIVLSTLEHHLSLVRVRHTKKTARSFRCRVVVKYFYNLIHVQIGSEYERLCLIGIACSEYRIWNMERFAIDSIPPQTIYMTTTVRIFESIRRRILSLSIKNQVCINFVFKPK